MTDVRFDEHALDVSERFIRAAETDRRRKVQGARPQAYGSSMPAYVHSYADMNGWRREPGDKLRPEDFDRYGNHRREIFDARRTPVSAADISALEECERWMAEFVPEEENRRALWKWAHSKVGSRHFNAWCFEEEGIHPETGRRRKNRAISQIERGLARKLLQNNQNAGFGVLLETARNAYFEPTLDEVGETKGGILSWFDDPSLAGPDRRFGKDERTFSWAEERREQRRLRRKAA